MLTAILRKFWLHVVRLKLEKITKSKITVLERS